MPRSISDNFPQKQPSPTISVIKSTTVTERLSSCTSNQLPPSAYIVKSASNNSFKVIKLKNRKALQLSIDNTEKFNNINSDTGTPIDTTVQSGLLLRKNDQIRETYL